jgi:hypothetical protein
MSLFYKIGRIEPVVAVLPLLWQTHLKPFATVVSKNNQFDEYMVTRLDNVRPALNIVHIYENDNRAGPDNILEGWAEILKELNAIEARNEVGGGRYEQSCGQS